MEEVSRKHGAFLAHGVRDLITTDDIDWHFNAKYCTANIVKTYHDRKTLSAVD